MAVEKITVDSYSGRIEIHLPDQVHVISREQADQLAANIQTELQHSKPPALRNRILNEADGFVRLGHQHAADRLQDIADEVQALEAERDALKAQVALDGNYPPAKTEDLNEALDTP